MAVERHLSPAAVVLIWGLANLTLAAVLIGFALATSASLVSIGLYCGSAALVFALAVLVWLTRRREPLVRGLTVPARPAASLLLAAGVALIWLGLPFGAWLPMMAAGPLATALILELTARRAGR